MRLIRAYSEEMHEGPQWSLATRYDGAFASVP